MRLCHWCYLMETIWMSLMYVPYFPSYSKCITHVNKSIVICCFGTTEISHSTGYTVTLVAPVTPDTTATPVTPLHQSHCHIGYTVSAYPRISVTTYQRNNVSAYQRNSVTAYQHNSVSAYSSVLRAYQRIRVNSVTTYQRTTVARL